MALVITLAGIAEEIYASLLKCKHGPGQRFVDEIVAMGLSSNGTGPADFAEISKFLYETRNGLKHANFEGEMVEVSLAIMTYTVGGALINRRRLGLAYTPLMMAAFDRIYREWVQFRIDNPLPDKGCRGGAPTEAPHTRWRG